MKVRILKSSGELYWYTDMIGEVRSVKPSQGHGKYEDVEYPDHCIDKEDCETVKEVDFIAGGFYLCNKDFFMECGEKSFTKGHFYRVEASILGSVVFRDGFGYEHAMCDDDLNIFEDPKSSSQKLEDISWNCFGIERCAEIYNTCKTLHMGKPICPKENRRSGEQNLFCGECKHLSITEEEQDNFRDKRKKNMPLSLEGHFCMKYTKKVVHGRHHPQIKRCKECLGAVTG